MTGQLQDQATRTHLEQADLLQMQAMAALVNEMNGWRYAEQQRKCMAALQGIHEHLRAVKDEVPLLLTDVRPRLLEIATGRPSVDYRTLVEEADGPDWVDLRRSLLETAVDAVAYMEAIDEVLAHEPATGDTGVSAAAAGEVRLSECSGSSAPAQRSRRRTFGFTHQPVVDEPSPPGCDRLIAEVEAYVRAVMTELAGTETLVHWFNRHVARVYRTFDDRFRAVDQLNACRHDHLRGEALRKAKAAIARRSGGRP